MARKKRRIPAVVPRIVFSTIFVGVVPACVASACGGSTDSTATDSGPDGTVFSVADVCFNRPGCPPFSVAAVAFQCFDGSTEPGCPQPLDGSLDGPDDALDASDEDAG